MGCPISWYVRTGFCNARQPIPAPPSDPDSKSGQDPHDEEYMHARPDHEEMKEAIENFLSRLEKQEERSFRDLHTLLSELPLPQPAAGQSLSVSEPIKAGFLPKVQRRCGGYVHAVRIMYVLSYTGSQVRVI